jgi:hypothetical protein
VAELPGCDATSCERVVAVASDARGRFVFVWERSSPAGHELFGELYGREGQLRVERFPVSAAPASGEQHPTAALTSDGTLLVAWTRAGEGVVLRSFRLE